MINENYEDLFCEKCNFIIKNLKTVYDTNELTDYMKNQDFKYSNKVCKFCFGVLSIDYESEIEKQLKEVIGKYEFVDFKLTTNFSPLFIVLQQFWKIKLKSHLKDPKDVYMIDVPLFRKTFKPLIAPKLEKMLQKKHENRSDFEIKCVFEFDESYYAEVAKF